jgi:hypothetical protein
MTSIPGLVIDQLTLLWVLSSLKPVLCYGLLGVSSSHLSWPYIKEQLEESE